MKSAKWGVMVMLALVSTISVFSFGVKHVGNPAVDVVSL